MKIAAGAFALLLALTGEPAQDGKIELTLSAKIPNPRAKRPLMRFDGSVGAPDLTVLFLTNGRTYETWARGSIVTSTLPPSSALVRVESKKFNVDSAIDAPGVYLVRVDIREEMQNPKVLPVAKKLNPRSWNFTFSAWPDDLVLSAASALMEIQELSREALEMLKAFEEALKTEESWKASGKQVVGEGNKTVKACQKEALKLIYPAALGQINNAVQNVHGSAQYFTFEAGKFAGATSYHADNQKIKTFRDEAFNFDNFRRYVQESLAIAGREFALWIIKDFRRSGNQLRPDASEAIKQAKAFPGVAEYSDRLLALKPEELEALETEIRNLKPGERADQRKDASSPPFTPKDPKMEAPKPPQK